MVSQNMMPCNRTSPRFDVAMRASFCVPLLPAACQNDPTHCHYRKIAAFSVAACGWKQCMLLGAWVNRSIDDSRERQQARLPRGPCTMHCLPVCRLSTRESSWSWQSTIQIGHAGKQMVHKHSGPRYLMTVTPRFLPAPGRVPRR